MAPTERALERDVRDLLRWLGAWLYEWAYRPGGDICAKKGNLDIIGCLKDTEGRGRFFAIELKAPHARRGLTQEQRWTIVAIMRAGGVAGEARSIDDVLALLAEIDPGIRERVKV